MAAVKTSDDSKMLDKSDTRVLSPEDLRMGMYVDLNCSWFKHLFPRRSFKLSSQSQIATIKGLGLGTVLVYPLESDLETDADWAPIEPVPSATAGPETERDTVSELAAETYRQMLGTSAQMMKDLSSRSKEGMRSAETMIGGSVCC